MGNFNRCRDVILWKILNFFSTHDDVYGLSYLSKVLECSENSLSRKLPILASFGILNRVSLATGGGGKRTGTGTAFRYTCGNLKLGGKLK